MKVVESRECPSKVIPEPYKRSLQLIFDKSDGDMGGDCTFLLSTLFPYEGKTDYHTHPVDEIIYITSGYGYSLSEEDKIAVHRARRLQRFLTQPFFSTEAFTGTPGAYVRLEDTLQGFSEILNGKHDDLPEQAFYMVGTIDDAIERAKELMAESSEVELG